MTLNRLATSLVQLFLWLPILFIIRELIKEKLNN
jgi:hypothetical protein